MKNYSRELSSSYLGDFFLKQEEQLLYDLFQIKKIAQDGELVLTNTHTSISDLSVLNCKLMIHPNSGFDNYTYHFIKEAPFPVILGNPIRASAVNEYILGILFYHFSFKGAETIWSQKRIWNRKLFHELKMLIVGFGHIGKLLHKSLDALNVYHEIYDPLQGLVDLSLKDKDVLILTAGLTQSSYRMIHRDLLKKAAPDLVIINVSRGEVVCQNDLFDFLKCHPQAFAYLDVFESEPASFQKWKSIVNLSCTSHIAGVFKNILQKTLNFEMEVIKSFLHDDKKKFEARYRSLILNKFPESTFYKNFNKQNA